MSIKGRKPTWSQMYRLGVEANKHLEHDMTLRQIADDLGITPQNAYTETVVALGKLLCLIRLRLGLPINHLELAP